MFNGRIHKIVVAGDTECFGVSDKFICGSWVYRNENDEIVYFTTTKKKEFEQWIIDFAKKKVAKKGNNQVHAYFHNLGYDYFRFADLEGRLSAGNGKEGYKPVSLTRKPMIDYVNEEGKVILRFFDTYRLISKSLKDIGLTLGYEKLEPSEKLQEKYKQDKEVELNENEINEMIKYNVRDTEIVLMIVEFIEKQLKEENYRPDYLCTIGQIAMGLFNKRLKALGMKWTMFNWKENRNDGIFDEYYLTKYPEEIRQAYKSGRIEAIQTGEFRDCTNIDFNSLFPLCMTLMPFPNIKKESKIDKPMEFMEVKDILNSIGVSKCRIECPEQELGYLPIRIKFGTRGKKVESIMEIEGEMKVVEDGGNDTHIEETIFPNHKCILEGVWTNFELEKAVKLGYIIRDIDYTIMYKPVNEKESPLKQFIIDCYEKRKKGNIESFFYKYVMNNLHGKFAQRITEGEYLIGDVSDADRFVNEGYGIKTRFGFNYVYVKEKGKKYARYFAPILSAYTTAYARDIMYNDLMKIPKEDRLYIGTDGILMKGNHLDKFSIGIEMGQYKVVKKDDEELKGVNSIVWGKNNYRVGKDVRISGVGKEIIKGLTDEDLKETFKYWRFPTIDRVNHLEELFERKWEEKNLERIRIKTEGLKEYIRMLPLIRDAQTTRDGD